MTDPVVEQTKATAQLGALLQNPAATVQAQSDGSVKVTTVPFWKRVRDSWLVRFNAAVGFLTTIWIAVPQDVVLNVIPPEYGARALLAYTIINILLKMRNI